jgi:hypothetical protein
MLASVVRNFGERRLRDSDGEAESEYTTKLDGEGSINLKANGLMGLVLTPSFSRSPGTDASADTCGALKSADA